MESGGAPSRCPRRSAAWHRLALLLALLVPAAGRAQECAPATARGDGGAVDFVSLFKDQYPSPVVDAQPTAVRGIWLCETFDHSQLAEDPLIPAYWLVTDAGHRYRRTAEDLARALAEVGFVPDSEQAALDAAQLIFSGGALSVLSGPQGVPKEVASRVTAPKVTRQGALFEVRLFVRRNDVRGRWRNREPNEPIVEHTVEIGKGILRDRAVQIHPPPIERGRP
jgi:hypothetical protein